jgi:hypothetical protein
MCVCVLPKDGICLLRSEQFIISDPQEQKSHFLINELVCISAEHVYTEYCSAWPEHRTTPTLQGCNFLTQIPIFYE